jgi:hypothetical protein
MQQVHAQLSFSLFFYFLAKYRQDEGNACPLLSTVQLDVLVEQFVLFLRPLPLDEPALKTRNSLSLSLARSLALGCRGTCSCCALER